METIRVQKVDGDWLSLECRVVEPNVVGVPAWKGKWAIAPGGMVGNVGGNDWRIYTLHPEDCARICAGMTVPA